MVEKTAAVFTTEDTSTVVIAAGPTAAEMPVTLDIITLCKKSIPTIKNIT